MSNEYGNFKPYVIPYETTKESGNPMVSSVKQINTNNTNQSIMVKSIGGKKNILILGGYVKVPDVNVPYSQVMPDGSQSVGNTIKNLTTIHSQNQANAIGDKGISKGGYTTKNNWGCMSGGNIKKSKRKTTIKKSKKKRKKT